VGLGLPFLIVGLALGRLGGTLGFVKRHLAVIVATSSMVLGTFGVLLVFDQLPRLTSELTRRLDRVGLDWLVELG